MQQLVHPLCIFILPGEVVGVVERLDVDFQLFGVFIRVLGGIVCLDSITGAAEQGFVFAVR